MKTICEAIHQLLVEHWMSRAPAMVYTVYPVSRWMSLPFHHSATFVCIEVVTEGGTARIEIEFDMLPNDRVADSVIVKVKTAVFDQLGVSLP